MDTFLRRFERIIIYILIIVAVVILVFQTGGLLWELTNTIIVKMQEVGLNYDPEYGRNVVLLFCNILLTLEVLETVKVYNQSREVKIRIIFIVCMIAISRKVLAMDISHAEPITELATAGMIVAFAGGYYLIRRTDMIKGDEKDITGQ